MLNITTLKSAKQAGNYYSERDDYYSEGGLAPARWYGRGAALEGRAGEVDPQEFTRELFRAEERGRRVGFDCSFHADKSVSALALAGSDDRVIRAHDRAVRKALDHLEANVGVRNHRRGASGESMEWERTGEITAAVFRHDTSRAQQPHLHSHAVIINRTHDTNGKDRALNDDDLNHAARGASQIYQLELAHELQRAGIAVERRDINGTMTTRVAGVSDELCAQLSTRSKQIEGALKQMGLTRESATRAQKQAAAYSTRRAKEPLDHRQLRAQWRAEVKAAGRESELTGERVESRSPDQIHDAADGAVRRASDILSERQSRFSARDLEHQALAESVGTGADTREVRAAIDRARERGDLLDRRTDFFRRSTRTSETEAAYTTEGALRTERNMLAAEQDSRGRGKPLMCESDARHEIEQRAEKSEYGWTKSQRQAALGVLTDRNRIAGIQGYAGTAKTTTVLATTAEIARKNGYEVVGIAPSASATQTLADAVHLDDHRTAASYLRRLDNPAERRRDRHADALAHNRADANVHKPRLVMVDEASLLGAKDMSKLLRHAQKNGDRVILTGDVRQLGSVSAGDAFKQLQSNGMRTHKLDEIVRQRTDQTREAVHGILERDAGRALDALRSQPGGGIRETREENRGDKSNARRKQIAADYLALSADERRKTIVIDPTRAGRSDLNRRIRDGLRKEGTVHGAEVRAESLAARDMTEQQARDTSRYSVGDRVVFQNDRKRDAIVGGEVYRVSKVNQRTKTLTLESPSGLEREVRPERIGRGKLSVFRADAMQLAAGDRVQWTRNDRDRKLKNGDAGRVLSVNSDKQSARVKFGAGKHAKTHDVDLRKAQPMRHDYATTAHAAQGKTCDRVMVHSESWRGNLVDNRLMYVAVSRAKQEAKLYTDDAKSLRAAIEQRAGERDLASENSRDREHGAERQTERKPQRAPTKTRARKRDERAESVEGILREGRAPSRERVAENLECWREKREERDASNEAPENRRAREERERRERQERRKHSRGGYAR
jgi:conjugative relaxase-like TrwC/TraI family protein